MMISLKVNAQPRRSSCTALALSIAGAVASLSWTLYDSASFAQDAAPQEEPVAHPAKKLAPKPVAKRVERTEKAAPAPARVAAATAPPPGAASTATPDFAAKLKENGAGACAPQTNAAAASSMEAVTQFNTVAHWASTAGDRRLVTVSLGQRYTDNAKVPFAATNVVASPNAQGSCDAVAVQIIPSPLSCAKLRESLSASGRQIGDLAGVPLMQDPNGQTMLIPTAAESCVLVGIKMAYAK